MAVVLAGGRSSRARGHKACRRIAGRPWLHHQCRHLRRQGFRQVRVVLGFSAMNTARCVPPGVRRIWNRNRALGSFASLQAGVRAARGGVLVVPVDAWPAAPSTLYRLRQALRGAPAAVPAWRGQGGHPVLLSGQSAAILAASPLSGTARLDRVLAAVPARRIAVRDRSVRGNMNRRRDWLLYLRCRNLRRPLWTG
ncbi:NTP transferase domain-containing protein [Acidiferrobacter sp.]|uniref:nucleotidyltransferase family protein n=1 Tax=Acidiferrobacter sp. TaxID=1872107 RepID=UPI00345BC376